MQRLYHKRPFHIKQSGERLTSITQNCQEYLRTLCSSITPDMLLTLPTPTFITVIGCGTPELIDMYIETTGCPFPVYADPTRKLYEILGMTRTLDLGKKSPEYMQSSVFSAVAHSIVQVVKNGNNALKGGNLKQVGGEFLFEGGQPIWCHRMRNTRDHAEMPELRRNLGLDASFTPRRKRWSIGVKDLQKQSRSRSDSWGPARSKSSARRKELRKSNEIEQKGLLEDRAQTMPVTTL